MQRMSKRERERLQEDMWERIEESMRRDIKASGLEICGCSFIEPKIKKWMQHFREDDKYVYVTYRMSPKKAERLSLRLVEYDFVSRVIGSTVFWCNRPTARRVGWKVDLNPV